MKKGAFTFVFHSHLPYCRRAGQWPHGEEWIHEAISETYLPLLNALYDLKGEGCRFKLTIGITPVLSEQLADPLIIEHFGKFVEDKIERASSDIERFTKQQDEHLVYLATFYKEYYNALLTSFNERFNRNIVGAFKKLQDNDYIEILTSAATHGYLPLIERDSSIYGQIKVGIESYRRHFGKTPSAIWLPECGYRPAYYISSNGTEYIKPGIEHFLSELGIGLFFSETHTIEGGEPVGKATGEVVGPYGNIPKRYVVPISNYIEPTMKTTYLPYWVQSAEVAVLGRNNRTGMQVWSADWGYPGEFDYREFHKKDGISGLQYWRITGARLDLAHKDYYHPEWADYKIKAHAGHYSSLVDGLINDFANQNQRYGIIAAAYDTELFGHWWFEGVQWIKEVLRCLSNSEVVEFTTASEYIKKHPPEDVLALKEGSWGQAGNHFTWQNTDTDWMWPLIHSAEKDMEELVSKYPNGQGKIAQVLNQAARELLLLQSSDWPFLVTTGQAKEYATSRFEEHVSRFKKLAMSALSGHIDEETIQLGHEFYELDNIFPNIDYRVFAMREGK
jgi:1,4-alpha-glucan branching enzyme